MSIRQALELADQIRPQSFAQDLGKRTKWELAVALKELAGAYRRARQIASVRRGIQPEDFSSEKDEG